MKRWMSVAVALVLVLVLAGAVLAQEGGGDPYPMPEPGGIVDPATIPDLPAFLEMLAGPQGWLLVGVLLSMVLEEWPWFKRLASDFKRLAVMGATVVVVIVARLLLMYTPEFVWVDLAPFWLAVAGVALTWIGSQGWDQLQKAARRGMVVINHVTEAAAEGTDGTQD